MDIKYTVDGKEIGQVLKVDDKVFVRFIYQYGDETVISNPIEYAGDIYDYPPVQRFNKELVGLREKINAATAELDVLRKRLAEAKKAENWVIDLSEFRNRQFWVFVEGEPLPIKINTKNPSFVFCIKGGKCDALSYTMEIGDDYGWKRRAGVSRISFSEPTRDEIALWIESSLENKTLAFYTVHNLPENLLNDNLIRKIKVYQDSEKSKKVSHLKDEISRLQEQLESLLGVELPEGRKAQ